MKDKESDWMCKGCLNQRNLNLDLSSYNLESLFAESEHIPVQAPSQAATSSRPRRAKNLPKRLLDCLM